MSSRNATAPNATAKWLSIVGIGEDGVDGLGAAAQRAVSEAEIVFGGTRHLELAAPIISGEARKWPSPFDTAIEDVAALRGRRICVLASGDPFMHGVGATLARQIDAAEVCVFPAPSAFSLAAARLGWPLQDVETVSLHGRPITHLVPLLHPGRRVLALTSDGGSPAAIAGMMSERGFGRSRVTVLESLGGQRESVSSFLAGEVGDRAFDPLNVLVIEVDAEPDTTVLPVGTCPGDEAFEHDGQITKHEIRALTLAALAPRRGELMWDIGAGAGSIAISWMLAHPSMRAVAIEANAERAARIGQNAERLGVPTLRVVEGAAPAALTGLPSPDAIFVGGGGSEAGVLDEAMEALRPGGRLVANAVTLEMEALLVALHGRIGGRLVRIALSRAEPIGTMSGWKPARPVTQFSWTKP